MCKKTPFNVSLVTKHPEELPAWVAAAAEKEGIVLTVRYCSTAEELLDSAAGADVIWTVGRNTCVTAEILPSLPRCKAIMRSGSGLDDLPVEAARARGLTVTNTPEAISGIVAEHTVALLFALVRQVVRHDRDVRNGVWESGPEWAKWHVPGQTLGLIGFGLIARETAALLQGFRLKVLVFDPYADERDVRASGARPVPLDELLQQSDFVSVHCPLNDQTRHLLGEAEFRMMKKNALLINTSRGAVLNEQALISALREGEIAGAALDVLEQEPPAADNPFLQMENVVLTPHIAAFSDEFEQKFWSASIAKLETLKKQMEENSK